MHLRACERVVKTHPMQKTCCLSLSLQSELERADVSLGFDSPLGLSDCRYSEHLSAVAAVCLSAHQRVHGEGFEAVTLRLR